jgi:hypothetical protein
MARWRTAVIVIVVLVVLVLVLVFVPVESSAFGKTAATRQCVAAPCSSATAEFTVGNAGYTTFSGTWGTNGTGADVVITINNGPSSQPCLNCSGQLYSSADEDLPTGSFDVSGIGPFHLSVILRLGGAQTTTIEATVDTAVL